LTIASPGKLQDEQPITEETAPLPHAVMQPETIDKDEIYLMGRAMMLSLTGFLAAGWFLSRAFVTTLFLLGGMAEAIYEMALRRGMIVPRLKLTKVIPYSGVLALSLLLMMYIVIRILNLIR
jgi:hypothetical protein